MCREARSRRDRLTDLAYDPPVSVNIVAFADGVEVLKGDALEFPIHGQEVAVRPLAVRVVCLRDFVS